MSLLFGEKRAVDASSFLRDDGSWGSTKSLAGESVSYSSVTGLDAVAAAVGLLSDLAYMLPLQGFSDRNGIPARLSPEASVISSPSLTVDARTWRAQAMVSWALWGNAYGLIVTRDRLEYPTTVEWLDPQRVSVIESSTLDRAPEYRLDGQLISPDRLIHRPGRYVRPGSRLGIVPLERFKETFGLALAARNYGSQWFGDGGHPSSILQSDQVITQEQAATIKARFLQAMRKRREPFVAGAGLTYKAVQTAPNESQFMETQNASAVAVARSFGLPADMIDATVAGGMTYANREQRALDFTTYHADPWLVRLEELVTALMPRTRYAKFNRDALLRTDALTRAQIEDIKVRGGIWSPNDVRRMEDEPPIPGDSGDQYLWPPYATNLPPAPTGAQP